MNLIPWKHKERTAGLPASGFRTEMDQLFQSFFGDAFSPIATSAWGAAPWGSEGWGLPLDIEETDKEILIRAEIPGVKPEELDLAISGNSLVISGEKKESEERKDKGYLYQERRFGSFRREVALPTAVDANNVDAEYKDGVLHVKLQKSEEALAKRIHVKAS
jgi:HSP20 family protein